MKNFRQKAVPAVAMLAVASLTLASVTYAWFTSNDSVQASQIDVNVVKTEGGIAISKTANGDYADQIAFTHMNGDTVVGDFANYSISPVSTDASINAQGKLTFYKGVASTGDPSNKLSRADAINVTDDAKKGYIVMDLYFENQNIKDQDVYFNYDPNAILNEMIGSSYPISTEALRLAFVNRGYVNNKPTTIDGGTDWTNGQDSGNALVIEPNSKKHLTQYDTNAAIKDIKQEYYGISGTFNDTQDIKPAANVAGKLTKVETDEVQEHNRQQGDVKFKSTDTDLAANGFYYYDSTNNDEDGWYLKSSIDYQPLVKYVEADLVEIGGVKYDVSTVKLVTPESLYAAADFPADTYTLIDGKYYKNASLNNTGTTDAPVYKLYNDEDSEHHDLLADHQVGEVKTAAVYALHESTEDNYDDKVADGEWNKVATVGDEKTPESASLKTSGTDINLKPEDVVREEAHTPLFTLEGSENGSTYSWIQVYVWLEGQDIDCLSSISNLDFTVLLKFVAYPVESTN